MTLFLLAAIAFLAPTTATNPTLTTPSTTALSPPAFIPAATPAPAPRTAPATPVPAAATAAPATPVPATATAAPAKLGAVWPLSPRPEVVRGFEPPPKPWLPGHRGLDLRGSPGQQVRSATSGTVTYAGPLAGRGVIVIANGPLRTTYEPVIPTVRVGTLVTPGTPLGHLSAAASHCAPASCLHWGLLQATNYLNPLTLLPHRPIRLLPLIPTAPPPRDETPPPPQPATSLVSPHTPRPPATDEISPAGRWPSRPTRPTGRAQAAPPPQLDPGAARGGAAPHAASEAPPRPGLASSVFVGLAAAATLAGSLMIRRH